MRLAEKNKKLSIFTFMEIVLAFAVVTVSFSVNLGYLEQLRLNTASSESATTIYFLNGFTALAVAVTILGMTGILLMQIHRRTYEIGLRKAVGAEFRDILLLILKGTLVTILVPALCGIVAGIVLSAAIPFNSLGLKANINLLLIAGCIFFVVLFAFLSGICPAVKAAAMNPADVLRRNKSTGREKNGRWNNIVFFSVISVILLGALAINHFIEAEFKKDVLNASGPPPAATQEAPPFSFRDAAGNVITSESLKGQTYCLLIWELRCPPSTDLLRELNQLAEKGQIDSSSIYAVNIDDTIDAVKEYIAGNRLCVATYIDHEKSVKWAFNANTTPAFYIINEEGVIEARLLAWSDAAKEYLSSTIEFFGKSE